MVKNLSIPEQFEPAMRRMCEAEIQAGEALVKEGNLKIEAAKALLYQLDSAQFASDNKPTNSQPGIFRLPKLSEFEIGWSWGKKARYILLKENREMTVNQLLDAIQGLQEIEDRRLAQGNLSSTLTTATKEGRIWYKTVVEGQEIKYGLLEWKKDKPNE